MQEHKLVVQKQSVIKPKKLSNKSTGIIDQDYLMYNSSEDEKQLRDYVQENYSNTFRFTSDES